jgi:hypothetical protein
MGSFISGQTSKPHERELGVSYMCSLSGALPRRAYRLTKTLPR